MEARKTEVLEKKSSGFLRWPNPEEVPAVIDEAVRLLVDEFDPLEVILFGSYARGDANEASDIDLLVVVPDEIQGTRHELNVRGGSRLWDMPMPIDLIVQRYSLVQKGQTMPESIHSVIKAQGKVLYFH